MQKTAYEMRISDWSSDVCSSDLRDFCAHRPDRVGDGLFRRCAAHRLDVRIAERPATRSQDHARHPPRPIMVEALENGVMLGIDRQKPHAVPRCGRCHHRTGARSEEHTSELPSLMRISYAVFCLKKKQLKQLSTYTHHLFLNTQ